MHPVFVDASMYDWRGRGNSEDGSRRVRLVADGGWLRLLRERTGRSEAVGSGSRGRKSRLRR